MMACPQVSSFLHVPISRRALFCFSGYTGLESQFFAQRELDTAYRLAGVALDFWTGPWSRWDGSSGPVVTSKAREKLHK